MTANRYDFILLVLWVALWALMWPLSIWRNIGVVVVVFVLVAVANVKGRL